MKALFQYKNYRELIKSLALNNGLKLKDMAEATECSHSYLSQVLTAEKANLNKDQAFKLALKFRLDSKETAFFLLLVDLANAGTNELKVHLEKELEDYYDKGLSPEQATFENLVEYQQDIIAEYYSNYLMIATHIATACVQFQTLESLCLRFRTSKTEMQEVLGFLLENQFVFKKSEKFIYQGFSTHLKKESAVYKSYHHSLRVNALLKNQKYNYNYSSLFALEKKDAQEIKSMLFELIQKKEKLTKQSGSEDVYLLCVDFLLA